MARHFQYCVEVFFKEIILDDPLGKVKYFAIRVEFQFRGSPHIHSFLWVLNAPVLQKETKEEYIRFVDQTVKCYLPDETNEPELYNMVRTYQTHSHSKSCRKYKNSECRYNYGRLFTEKMLVAEPVSKDISDDEKTKILLKRRTILDKVKEYINKNLCPGKVNFLDPSREDYVQLKTIPEILQDLDISVKQYYETLSISSDNDFQIHFKRPPNSCFINNYFAEGLIAWKANMDIQPVFNHYKAVTYMCAYFSKSEDDTSLAMKQAAKEASEKRFDTYQQMRVIAQAYATKRECSVQEAVYHVMPELWMRKCFPGVIFANSNLPEDRYKICKSEEEIMELPEDSTDIYKRNMLDRYIDRPNATFKNGKYSVLDKMCYAEFLSHYYLASKPYDDMTNDFQQEVLIDEVIEVNHPNIGYPVTIPLMSSEEKLKCRKVKCVLRYHVPNRHIHPEKYSHHMLFMFYPFRNENELKFSQTGLYADKLLQETVLSVVNRNKEMFEPYGDMVDTAIRDYRADALGNQDNFAQQENDDVLGQLDDMIDNANDPDNEPVIFDEEQATIPSIQIHIMSDDQINSQIRSLNVKQWQIFDAVHKWAKEHVKNLGSLEAVDISPLYLFISGSGGVGKSHLIKTLYQSLTKLFTYRSGDPNKVRVLLIALIADRCCSG